MIYCRYTIHNGLSMVPGIQGQPGGQRQRVKYQPPLDYLKDCLQSFWKQRAMPVAVLIRRYDCNTSRVMIKLARPFSVRTSQCCEHGLHSVQPVATGCINIQKQCLRTTKMARPKHSTSTRTQGGKMLLSCSTLGRLDSAKLGIVTTLRNDVLMHHQERKMTMMMMMKLIMMMMKKLMMMMMMMRMMMRMMREGRRGDWWW